MNKPDLDFILANHKKLSSRQISKKLGVSRTEVEKIIRQTGQALKESPEPAVPFFSEKIYLLVLFLAAIFIRLVYVFWLSKTPFFEPLSPKLDDGVYDALGQQISGGNWLADVPFSAYRVPLYPYFLAGIYHLFGHSLMAVHLIQSFLGALTPLIAFGVAKRATNSLRTAMIAGVMTCAYIPFIFYENILLGESLSIFLNLLALFLLVRLEPLSKLPLGKLSAAGFFMGLSILLRPNTLVPAVLIALYLVWRCGIEPKKYLRGFSAGLLFMLCVLAPLFPVTARNYHLHNDIIPITAVGGINFYVGNNPEADGKFSLAKGIGTGLDEMVSNSHKLAEEAAGRVLKPSEASAYWLNKGLNFIFSSPHEAVRLYLRKVTLFLNNYEFPDILDLDFVSQFIPFLSPGVWMYGAVLVLSLSGIILGFGPRGSKTGQELLRVFAGGYGLSVILFFVTARYRLPVVPGLIIFASVALDRALNFIKLRNSKELAKSAAIAAVAAFIVFLPMERTSFGTNYNSLAIAMKNKGDFAAAEKFYRKAMEAEPFYPSPYYNLALLYDQSGRSNESAALHRKYEELKSRLN